MRRGLLLLVIFVLLTSFVTADNFVSLIEPIKNDIYTDQKAEFKLYLTNELDVEDTIHLRFNDLYWDIQSDPLYHYFSGIRIQPGETIESLIYFTPTTSIGIGRYIVGLDIVSEKTKTRVSKPLTINVKPQFPFEFKGEYQPLVDITTDIPEKIDPREDIIIKVNLKNRNPLDIKELDIYIESELMNEFRTTPLPPLLEKTEEFRFRIDDLQSPIDDTMTITVKRNNETLRVVKKSFSINAYSDILREYEEKQYFMKRERIFKLTNIGNIENTDIIKLPTGSIKKWFDTTLPESRLIKEYDGLFNQWEITLGPNQSTEVKITSDYKSILISFILIIILIIAYFVFRAEVVVKKVGTTISMKEGGTSEIKILIFVKNRAKNFVQDLNIVDRIPNMVELSSENVLGTLKPIKVLRHEKKGTLMKWHIEALESQEERILSYKIITTLSILGQFNLPSVVVKYKDIRGNEKIVSSNVSKV